MIGFDPIQSIMVLKEIKNERAGLEHVSSVFHLQGMLLSVIQCFLAGYWCLSFPSGSSEF